jgi:hypothetical protein
MFVRDGGLLSYGVSGADLYRGAASYVDRILRGAKPSELPVQLPTKFLMVVNRKTANALGLAIPPSILLRADEVIERFSGASSSPSSAARRRGRSRHARSRATAYGASLWRQFGYVRERTLNKAPFRRDQ